MSNSLKLTLTLKILSKINSCGIGDYCWRRFALYERGASSQEMWCMVCVSVHVCVCVEYFVNRVKFLVYVQWYILNWALGIMNGHCARVNLTKFILFFLCVSILQSQY